MSNKPLNIGEEARVQMPMKTVASLIVIVAMGVWGYFGIVEKLNQHSTRLELMEKDLTENDCKERDLKERDPKEREREILDREGDLTDDTR